ncbi:MAG: cysteine desulfurase [Ignavibacteria bacterium]|nr:cysteine desulfurase [Ignavibacteria bacterium]
MEFIYADYAATTPTDPRVVEVMMPYFSEVFYNASSTHAAGMQAQKAVMQARMDIARHLGAKMSEIVFTSGATEAINLAVLGAARKAGTTERSKIVTSKTEHAAMLDTCQYCKDHGHQVEFCGVDENGLLLLDELEKMVDGQTLLVSVMTVNNETGVKQDLKSISAIAHKHGALFMTDATQAYGKMLINVDELGIDLLSLSGHKIYGPKGVGALFMRNRKELACQLEAMQYGGGQEGGIRSGTLNVPGIVGLAAAGNIAHAEMEKETERLNELRMQFENALKLLPTIVINGEGANRSYNVSNICFHGVDVDMMLMELEHVAVSKGSACHSTTPKPSHVLVAMGRTAEQAGSSLRFSFGRYTSNEEIEELIKAVTKAHEKHRAAVNASL